MACDACGHAQDQGRFCVRCGAQLVEAGDAQEGDGPQGADVLVQGTVVLPAGERQRERPGVSRSRLVTGGALAVGMAVIIFATIGDPGFEADPMETPDARRGP